MFHRDAGYLEGRRVRRSREMRAMAGRTTFGRSLLAEQWAAAEFGALSRLRSAGVPVPYPARWDGREVMLELIGDPDGTAAPRLAQPRPAPDRLADLWHQLTGALLLLAGAGPTHGDLSAYNLLLHGDRLVLIDLPRVVDPVGNPSGDEFPRRDVRNITAWFEARGLPATLADPAAPFAGWWPRRSARGSRLTRRRGSMSARLLVSSISVRVALYRTLRAGVVTPGRDT